MDQGVEAVVQGEQLKWLRFYWDCCGKCRHPAEDRESLERFLQKLATKGQSVESPAAGGLKCRDLLWSTVRGRSGCGIGVRCSAARSRRLGAMRRSTEAGDPAAAESIGAFGVRWHAEHDTAFGVGVGRVEAFGSLSGCRKAPSTPASAGFAGAVHRGAGGMRAIRSGAFRKVLDTGQVLRGRWGVESSP
jgi:hypothetical protein